MEDSISYPQGEVVSREPDDSEVEENSTEEEVEVEHNSVEEFDEAVEDAIYGGE